MGDNASEKESKNENFEERVKNEIEKLKRPEDPEKPKKSRKPFEWTDKRLEAFKKMREGLVTKNEITKELKAEKKKSEKDEIKKRIRDLMNQTSSSKKVENDAADVSDESESDGEVVVSKPAKKQRGKEKEEKTVKSKSKRSRTPPPSEDSSEEEDESSSEEEEERVLMTKKQHQKLIQSKQNNGKAPRNARVFNAMDNFILL